MRSLRPEVQVVHGAGASTLVQVGTSDKWLFVWGVLTSGSTETKEVEVIEVIEESSEDERAPKAVRHVATPAQVPASPCK